MRGIATIDRQPNSETIAVWITGRTDLMAHHTNAVEIDAANDPNAIEKVRSLTRCCVVFATEGSVLDGMPIEGAPLSIADVAALLSEAQEAQTRILGAIADYKKRARSSALVAPTFPKPPTLDRFRPETPDASTNALAAANYVSAVWNVWLRTDEERRRRTAQPRTGKTPWIMPDSMNAPTVADFPTRFAARLREQALV